MESLDGKVAWITGAGSGIGRACAVAFARAGARVALTGRRLPPLEETAVLTGAPAGDVVIALADVSDAAAVAAITSARAAFACRTNPCRCGRQNLEARIAQAVLGT